MSVMRTTLSYNPQEALEKFDPPNWVTSLFPTGEDRLKGAENWPSWSLATKNLLRAAEVWNVVSGEELRPPPSEGVKFRNWTVKDTYAKINISRCVESRVLALRLAIGDMSSYEMWMYLQSMYQQKGTDSILFWMKKLGQKVDGTSAMTQHVESFQNALRHLANAGMNIDEDLKAGFLLVTLMNDHKTDLDSWSSFATNFPFDKTTKLSTVIASIFEEACKRTTNLKAVDPGSNLNLTVCQVLNSVEKDRRPAKRPKVSTVVVQKNAPISENRATPPAPVSEKVPQKRKHFTGFFSNEKARSSETVESCQKGKDRQAKRRAKAAITKEYESQEEDMTTDEYCGMQ